MSIAKEQHVLGFVYSCIHSSGGKNQELQSVTQQFHVQVTRLVMIIKAHHVKTNHNHITTIISCEKQLRSFVGCYVAVRMPSCIETTRNCMKPSQTGNILARVENYDTFEYNTQQHNAVLLSGQVWKEIARPASQLVALHGTAASERATTPLRNGFSALSAYKARTRSSALGNK